MVLVPEEFLIPSMVMGAMLVFVWGGFQYVPAVVSVWHFALISYSWVYLMRL